MCAKIKEKIDASIEGKLRALYELQIIDSKIDRIRTVRGELPLEVRDLEDLVTGFGDFLAMLLTYILQHVYIVN